MTSLRQRNGIEYPISEIIDRLTILQLKQVRLREDCSVATQLRQFRSAIHNYDDLYSEKFLEWRNALLEVNSRIWDLEAAIRTGAIDSDLEEVGRRALAIRDLNRERIRIKNEIARALGEYEEIKIDHASAEPANP